MNFKKINRDLLLKITCYVSVFLLLLTIGCTILLNNTYPDQSGTLYGKYLFSDFAETLSYCIAKNPYNGESGIHSIYPPFAYLIFFPFALICKQPLQQMLNGEIALGYMYQNKLFVFSFILYFIINMALILLVVAKMSKLKGKNLVYLLIIVGCFGPFIYAFGRANVILTAGLFALVFFWLYNSEKRWQRELANLALACSIATKIYPIILVIFFLKDRRFLDLLKTIGYSVALLILPFALIDGGFGNILEIWNNFTHFNSGEGRNGDMSNISLDALAYKLTYAVNPNIYPLVSSITRHGLLLTALVTLVFSKGSKKTMQCMIVSICTYELWQGVSYGYTMLFLVAPIVLFLVNFDELSKLDKYYYGVCFAIITAQIFYVFNFFALQSIALVALVVKAIVDLIIDNVKRKKETKQLAI